MIAARLSSGALQKQETGVGTDFFFFLKRTTTDLEIRGTLTVDTTLSRAELMHRAAQSH